MTLHYAIFGTAGIYLGSHDGRAIWTRRWPHGFNGPMPKAAPTFAGHAAVEAELDKLDNLNLDDGNAIEHKEVWPDLPDGYASPDAFRRAALPAWDPNATPCGTGPCPRCGRGVANA